MKNIQEVKEKYPDVSVSDNGTDDSYREGVEIVERDPIAVIIKHPTDDLYLIAKWKMVVWNGLLTGGIEEGDTLEDTVRKEIHEESGYTNVAYIMPTEYITHGLFYHPVKKVNRLAHYHLTIAVLGDLTKDEVSPEEQSIADFVWVKEDEVLPLLTRQDMVSLWKYFLENKESLLETVR